MINLVKGQNAQLDLNKFHVGLGWDVREDRTSSYDFDLDVSAFSVEFCRLYRRDGAWKVQALGNGHRGGLEELVAKYV